MEVHDNSQFTTEADVHKILGATSVVGYEASDVQAVEDAVRIVTDAMRATSLLESAGYDYRAIASAIPVGKQKDDLALAIESVCAFATYEAENRLITYADDMPQDSQVLLGDTTARDDAIESIEHDFTCSNVMVEDIADFEYFIAEKSPHDGSTLIGTSCGAALAEGIAERRVTFADAWDTAQRAKSDEKEEAQHALAWWFAVTASSADIMSYGTAIYTLAMALAAGRKQD